MTYIVLTYIVHQCIMYVVRCLAMYGVRHALYVGILRIMYVDVQYLNVRRCTSVYDICIEMCVGVRRCTPVSYRDIVMYTSVLLTHCTTSYVECVSVYDGCIAMSISSPHQTSV